MREGWGESTLGELFSVERGGSPRPIKNFITSDPNGINWIKIGDAAVGSKYITETAQKIKPEGVRKSRMVYEGDFVLSNSMSFGRPYIMKTEGCIHDGWVVLRKSERLDPNFLYYALSSGQVVNQFERSAAGTTVRNLNIDRIRAVTVPVPPLPEQRRIVAILDEAFEGIAAAKANAEKNLENAREVFEAEMAKIFDGNKSWRSCLIEDVINFIDYRGKTPKKTGSGLRLITAKNVKMGLLKDEPAEYVEPSSYDSWMTRGIPKKGDVLFTTEAPLANVAELDTDEKVVFAQRIIIMQPNPSELFSPFLKYMLMSQPLQKNIHDNGTGATVKGIKSSLLKKIKLSFPKGLKQQKEISKRLELIEQSVGSIGKLVAQKLNTLDELKKSLLHQAFNGDL